MDLLTISRVLMLALLLCAGRAAAQPVPAIQTEPIESAAQALEADAAEYARTFAVPLPEALRRLEAQEASVPLVDRLADGYRDRLAGLVIEHRPDYRILLIVTGPPAEDVQIATAPPGVPVILRTTGLAARAQTLAAIERHQAEIRAAMPSSPGMGVDPETGALLVVTRPGDLDGDADRIATAARLQAIAGVPVAVRTWGDFDQNLTVEGGGRVTGTDADRHRFLCTSGFVVTDGTRTALSTAAHCPDALSYIERDGTETPLTMIGAWGARTQDVQLHVGPRPFQPLIHADDETRTRIVTTWRNRASTRAGDVVCHRGQRTGYSCALVRIADYAPPGDLCAGPCPATWVAVSGPKCRGGDSGGPVFLGSVAFGLVKGDSNASGVCTLYYYMSVDQLPAGWTVMTGTTVTASFSAGSGLSVPPAASGGSPPASSR